MEHSLSRDVSMVPSSRFVANGIRRIAMRFEKALLMVSAAFVVASGFVASAPSASARVVCNREGDCWTTHANVHYPREYGVRVYNDRYADQHYRDRRWHASNRKWHDEGHDHDRGAYRNGQWVTF
jgi:hypothetical protein